MERDPLRLVWRTAPALHGLAIVVLLGLGVLFLAGIDLIRVLLDEVAAHLDPSRRAALFDEITALGLQTFLTGTDRSLFEGLFGRGQGVKVEGGALEPEG